MDIDSEDLIDDLLLLYERGVMECDIGDVSQNTFTKSTVSASAPTASVKSQTRHWKLGVMLWIMR